jgi:hypothetical protein
MLNDMMLGGKTFRITTDSIKTASMTLEIIGYTAPFTRILSNHYSLERRYPDYLDAD